MPAGGVLVVALGHTVPSVELLADELVRARSATLVPVVAEQPYLRVGPVLGPSATATIDCFYRRLGQHGRAAGRRELLEAYDRRWPLEGEVAPRDAVGRHRFLVDEGRYLVVQTLNYARVWDVAAGAPLAPVPENISFGYIHPARPGPVVRFISADRKGLDTYDVVTGDRDLFRILWPGEPIGKGRRPGLRTSTRGVGKGRWVRPLATIDLEALELPEASGALLAAVRAERSVQSAGTVGPSSGPRSVKS